MLSLQQAQTHLDQAKQLSEQGKYPEAIELLEQAAPVFEAAEDWEGYVQCLNQHSRTSRRAGEYDIAMVKAQKALQICLGRWGGNHNLNTADSYNSLGVCYDYKGNYSKAIDCFQKALSAQLVILGVENKEVGATYSNIGVYYFYIGDYYQAIAHHKQALYIDLIVFGELHLSTATTYDNLGLCYSHKGDYIISIAHHQRALNIRLSLLGEQHPQVSDTYNNLGVCYDRKSDYEQSIVYNQKALSIELTTLGEKHFYTAQSYHNLGVCYYRKGYYSKTIEYIEQSISIKLAIFGKKHPETSSTYLFFAQLHHTQSQYPQALHYHQQALQSLALDVPNEDYYPLPKLKGYNSAVELLEVLPAKATTFTALYHQTQNPQDLTAALAHYQCADELIDQMRQSFKTEGSKLILAEKGKDKVYDAGLEALFAYQSAVKDEHNNMLILSQFNQTLGYHLPNYPIDLAFHFSEKSKAVLLFAGMKDAEARVNAQLPPDLVQQEYDLRIELTYLERRISEEGYKKPEERDQTALNEWQSQHFEFKNKYDALIERLETDYPKYYQLKYNIGTATIAQVQAALPPQKAMISYVLAAKHLYIIIITAQNSTWLQTNLPTDFEGLVEDFLFSFQSIGKRDYLTYSYDLYRHLMLPAINTGMLQGIQQLIIIPDAMLSRVPFEALLTHACSDDTAYKDFPYLLHQYRIAYHYSATLWLNQQTASPPPAPPTGGELSWEEALPPSGGVEEEFKTLPPSGGVGGGLAEGVEEEFKTLPPSGGAGGGLDFIGFAPVYSPTAQNSTEHDIDLILPDDFYEKIGIEKPTEEHRIEYTETAEAVRGTVEGRDFVELIHSETEVRNVGELFAAQRQTAKILLHTKATLDNFKALSGKYRYILVAAHADYNGEKPDQTGIIFSPNETDGNGIFYMGDAYNLQLQADLVVLSCCETGLGKVSKGEGTMALNRGFLYSGAKNVVYTLFKVYDKQSCELTTELFKQLIAQQPSIEALHQAKLTLIARNLMPNKWAGYVLVGQ